MNADEIRAEIEKLTRELTEAEAAIPAHTVRPHQMMRVEQLEDRIDELRAELALETGE